MGKRLEKRLNSIELVRLGTGRHADGNGLCLDVQESGSRSWMLRSAVRGKRKDVDLGGLSTTSLADARHAAGMFRARARKGEDILETKRIEKRIIPTFKEAAISEFIDPQPPPYYFSKSNRPRPTPTGTRLHPLVSCGHGRLAQSD